MSCLMDGLVLTASAASYPMAMIAPVFPLAKTSACCGVASSLFLGAVLKDRYCL